MDYCRRLGHHIVIAVGHPDYCPRFRFSSARAKGLEVPFPVPDEGFMVIELTQGALDGISGMVVYPAPFNDVLEAAGKCPCLPQAGICGVSPNYASGRLTHSPTRQKVTPYSSRRHSRDFTCLRVAPAPEALRRAGALAKAGELPLTGFRKAQLASEHF